MGTPTLSVGPENRRCRAKIHLCLFAGQTFHPAKRYRPVLSQTFDKPANTVVAALKSVLVPEVLIDLLPGQPALQFVLDDFAEGFTLTLRPGFMGVLFNGPGGRVGGWFWVKGVIWKKLSGVIVFNGRCEYLDNTPI